MSHSDLYNVNGLVFWSEEEIRIRNMFVDHMVAAIRRSLLSQNQAFKLIQCEAPILTPYELVSKAYDYSKDIFVDDPENLHLAFRPETTMGSYAYARHILSGYHDPKFKLPICVWQHGKSFRREQDQPTKFMRLKEFHQLEFQILFAANTANDYYPRIVEDVRKALSDLLVNCKTEKSDRLPDYSDETIDVVFVEPEQEMEVCSISRRKDFDPNIKNIEVAIGTDRCVHNFLKRR
jgi:glycyl-tRNA synthetase